MGKPSKKELILDLFYNEPTKHWHFSEIVALTNVSENIAAKWLRIFQKKNLIKRVKPRYKMPYFIATYASSYFKNKKRLYALQKLYETGLADALHNLANAKLIIIFGSYVRADWNTNSDVDVFIYGDSEELAGDFYWDGLGLHGKARLVQVHTFHTISDIKDAYVGLLNNITRGFVIKGDLMDLIKVMPYARTQ